MPRQCCEEEKVEFINSSQPILPQPSGHPCPSWDPLSQSMTGFTKILFGLSQYMFSSSIASLGLTSGDDASSKCRFAILIDLHEHHVRSMQVHGLRLFLPVRVFYSSLPTTTHWSFILWRAMHSSVRLTFLHSVLLLQFSLIFTFLLFLLFDQRPKGYWMIICKNCPMNTTHKSCSAESGKKGKLLENVSFISVQSLRPTSIWGYQTIWCCLWRLFRWWPAWN